MVGFNGPPKKKGMSDNFQTPPEALDILIPYLKKDWLILEPACGKGNIVKALKKHKFAVTWGDKNPVPLCFDVDDATMEGEDFLERTFTIADCIVTNPPYTLKDQFLEKCYELKIPFALLLPLTALESEKRQKLFRKYGIQIIIPNKRYNFETPTGKGSSAWFATAWFTWGLNLPKDLNFVDVKREKIIGFSNDILKYNEGFELQYAKDHVSSEVYTKDETAKAKGVPPIGQVSSKTPFNIYDKPLYPYSLDKLKKDSIFKNAREHIQEADKKAT